MGQAIFSPWPFGFYNDGCWTTLRRIAGGNRMSRRNEEKKQRRLKRQKKRQRFERSIDDSHDLPEPPEAFAFLRTLKQLFDLPRPARWPGVSDRALARPDLVKLDLAEWASREEPGKGKLRRLETGFQSGLLGFLPDMEHSAMAEF